MGGLIYLSFSRIEVLHTSDEAGQNRVMLTGHANIIIQDFKCRLGNFKIHYRICEISGDQKKV